MPRDLTLAVALIAAFVGFAILARFVHRLIWNISIPKRLAQEENAAHGIELSGYLLGVLLIASSVLGGISSGEHAASVQPGVNSDSMGIYALQIAIYGIAGVVALGMFGRLGVKILLRVDMVKSIHANNVAAGIVASAADISTALVIAGVFSGQTAGADFAVAIIFLLVGLGTLWAITYLYRFITSYNDSREIMNENVAAALSYAGMMIAVGMIVGHAVEGDFVGFGEAFMLYGKTLLAVLFLYPVRQFIVQGILLGDGVRLYGVRLDDEISIRRNVGAGTIELAAYIVAAVIAFHVGY